MGTLQKIDPLKWFALALLVTGCTQIVPAPPPPDAPAIQRFEASAQVISANEQVRLSFSISGATNVSLVDDSGQALQLEGTVGEGSVSVNPSRTTFYVLRAFGPGGVVSAFLQIAVNEPLREVFLLAVPPVIEAGGHSQLLWSAPGARTVTLTERGKAAVTLTGTSGLVPITPSTSTGYRLAAQGAPGTPAVDALVEVRVRPAITSLDFTTAQGVRPGEPMNFTWTTRAATRLTLSERSLGQITEVTDADQLADGRFAFVVPSQLPGGAELVDGFPLHFTFTASSGTDQAIRELDAAVGNHPMFASLTAPSVVTSGGSFTFAWRTFFTSRVAVELGGQTIFETPTADRAVNGSVTLPAPSAATDYVLVASNERGQSTRRTVHVALVPGPAIVSFNVPSSLASPGAASQAQWVTSNAERVTLRLDQGPALARVTTAADVRMGTAPFTLASTAYLTLEASNAAGDTVRQTRLVTVTGSATNVSPQPALRSATGSATLEWQLSALGVTSVVGLPTPGADGGVDAWVDPQAFVDLSTSPTATSLQFSDPGDGAELLARVPGFEVTLLGRPQPELWVSVNGFISFERPGALATNADFQASSVNTPTMLAPFWDDLMMPAGAQVLSELVTLPSGERTLVVQWDKLQQQGLMASELSFQVQLSESGQVVFAYKTLTSVSPGFTAGVNVNAEGVHQSYAFNTTGGTVSPGTRLEFFNGGPANGALEVATTSSRWIHFFGRTPTGLLPVSAEVRVVGAGDLAITEAMPFPEANAISFGQWVEVRNVAHSPIQLEGVNVVVGSSDGGTVLPRRLLQPGEFLVLGQSTDPQENGGAGVELVMNDVLGTSDSVSLMVDGAPVASLSWDGGAWGESIFVPEGILVSPGASVSCARTMTFGPDGGAHGSPGALNERCAPYAISSVAPGYVDPSSASFEVLESANSFSGFGTFLLPVAFTYFGQSYTSVNASIGGGFLSFGPPLTNAFVSNPDSPLMVPPNGVVAPFWDELVRHTLPEGDGALKLERLPGRTVITWQDFHLAGDLTSHLNFQVHLVDPDVIEFHYGSMATAGVLPSLVDPTRGSSATVWIEDPQGRFAIPFSVNEQRISPFMNGVRFTPAP